MLFSQADGLYYSPYSYYGLGDRVYHNSLRNRALGSIGIANSSPINVIMDNPASYVDLKQTTFEFSAYYKFSNFITDSLKIHRSHLAFDGLTLGFPSNKKFTLVLGLNPYTKSGYKVKQISDITYEEDTIKLLTVRSGDGGINQVVLGLGFPIFHNKLNIGANANFYFGSISRFKETVFLGNNFIGTMVRNRVNYRSIGFHFGIMYSDTINKSKFRVGAVYQPNFVFQSASDKIIYDIIPNSAFPSIVEFRPYDTLTTESSHLKLPSILSFGIGMDNFNKFAWGLDFHYYDGSQIRTSEPNTVFQKSYKINIGLEWVPKFSEESYWKKIAYRFGGYYHQSELKLFEKSINQMAITFGMGFPFRKTFSRLNLFAEVGQRGLVTQNLVKEFYFSLGLGVTFNETWFIKRKLD